MSSTIDYLGTDVTPDMYFGLVDTGVSFTGSTTMQDVQLGSPVPLDTSQSTVPDASVTDLLPQVPTSTWNPTGAEISQMLAGTSDTAPSSASMIAGTPLPNVTPPNAIGASAISALGKFGSSLAGLFGQQPRIVSSAATMPTNVVGTPLSTFSATNSGSFTMVLIIVFGALILLMLRD